MSSAATGHSSSLAFVTAKATPAATPANSAQSPQVQNISVFRHPISSGTIAGILVGGILFLVFTTASAMLCWRRRHRFSQTAIPELPDHQTHDDVKSNPAIWIPELDHEGAVYGPHELAGTPTPTAQSVRSREATESQPREDRVSKTADSGGTSTPLASSLRSVGATESQPAEDRVSSMADPSDLLH